MTTLSFDIIGRDRGASRTLTDVGRSADKSAANLQRLKTVAAVSLVAVTAAAIKFGASSVRAYSEAQSAQLRLQDAFTKFPKLANTNIGALRNLNTELAKKTRFDDDATASGQAVLAQFKLTGQQITQLTPLLQDYAAKTGKDLPTAAKDLGKAMMGSGRALKVIGVDFKDTGTAGGNFTQIMSGLRTQVGGFAEREGKTAAGQAEILKNQFGELQESVGQALLPALLKVGGGLLKAVNGFNDLSDSAKSTVLGVGGSVVTFGLTALAVGKIAAAAKAARDAFRLMGLAGKTAVVGIPVIGAALAAASAVIGHFAGEAAKAKGRTDDIRQSLSSLTGVINQNTAALDHNVRAAVARSLQDAKALDAATKLGIGLDTLTDAALGNQEAVALVHGRMLAAYNDGNNVQVQAAMKLSGSFGSVAKSTADAIAQEKQYRDAVGGAGQGAAWAGPKFEAAGEKTKKAGEKARDAAQRLRDLAAAMFRASKAGLELSGTEISFEQAVDDASASVKANGRTLDTNTQKGRDNRTALNNLITTGQGYISKLVETGKSSKRVQAASKDAKEEFIRVARSMGVGRDRARELADKYFKIPKRVETAISQPGMGAAQRNTSNLDRRINNINGKSVAITFTTNAQEMARRLGISVKNYDKDFGNRGYGAGGYTGNLPPWAVAGEVHGDEHVIRSPSRRRFEAKYPGYLRHINETGDIPSYRDGGTVARGIRVGVGRLPAGMMRFPTDVSDAVTRAAAGWGKGAQDALLKKLNTEVAGGQGVTGPVGGMTTFRGGRFTSLAAANLRRAEQIAGMTMHVMQGGWRPRTSYSGTSHAGDAVDTQASARLIRAIRAVGWASGDRTGLGNWGSHAHSVPSPSTGRAAGSAVGQYQDYVRRGGARQGLRSPWGLASGGLLTAQVAEQGPERLLDARTTRNFDRMVRVMNQNGGAVTYVVNISAPNYVGSRQELRQTLVDMTRAGAFEVFKR